MKTSSQESVRGLFNLSNEEKIYDDFGCAYSDVILYHGRLFLTENFICFNSNILGLKNKYIIPLKDVKDIKKRKTLGIFNNSIEIKAYNASKKQDSTYVFTSFASRNIAYKRIKMVWKAYARMNKILISNGAISGTTSVSGKPVQYATDSESNSSEEEAEVNLNGINRSTNLSELNVSLDSEGLDNPNNSAEVYFPPIDPDKVYECSKIEVKLSANEFFDKFLSDNAEFSIDKFYIEEMGHVNVNRTEWKELEPGSSTQIRDINFMMKVKDVPFISQTRVHKAQKLKKEALEKGGEQFILSGSSSSLDVPYSSYFSIEDTWEIIPYTQDKCVVRTSICVNFTKSTMFRSKIEKKTKEEFKKEIDKWCEFITSKGVNFEIYNPGAPKKPSRSSIKEEEMLLHGVERIEGGISDIRKKFSPVAEFVFKIQNFLKNYYQTNPKDFLLFLSLFVLGILVLSTLIQVNSYNKKSDLQIEYLNEIKKYLTKGEIVYSDGMMGSIAEKKKIEL